MSFHIGYVVFPNLTQLDFTGPLQVRVTRRGRHGFRLDHVEGVGPGCPRAPAR